MAVPPATCLQGVGLSQGQLELNADAVTDLTIIGTCFSNMCSFLEVLVGIAYMLSANT